MAKNAYTKLMETLVEDQRAMTRAVAEQGATLAVCRQQISDTHDRLFGDEGAIPRLGSSIKAVDVKATTGIEKALAAAAHVDKRLTYYSGMAAGLGTLLGIFGKALLSRLGLHF